MWISPNDEACEVDRGSMEPPPRDFEWAFLNPAVAGIPLLLLEEDEDFVEAVFFPWGCDILSRARARLVLTGINTENAHPDCHLETQQRSDASKRQNFMTASVHGLMNSVFLEFLCPRSSFLESCYSM